MGKAVSAIVPSEEKAEPRQPQRRESGRRQQGDVFRPGGWRRGWWGRRVNVSVMGA